MAHTPKQIPISSMSHSDRESHDAGLIVTSNLVGDGQVLTLDRVPRHLLPIPEVLG